MDKPTPSKNTLIVVRPYGARIRDAVFAAVERAGFAITSIIPPGTSNDQAVRQTIEFGTRQLLVPYHGHRDQRGVAVDGVSFLHALANAHAPFRWRVIMPISQFGAAAAEISLERLPADVTQALALIRGDDLKDPRLSNRIRRHLLKDEA